ncbi:hypothetical protein NL676_023788 [Syzygium grande]|nr:hypothetical protein NL676_023788 [Syzygium grande]
MGAKGKSEKRSAWEKLAKFDTCPRSKQSFSIVAKRRVQAVPFHSVQAAGPSSPFPSWPSSGSKQSCSYSSSHRNEGRRFARERKP